MRRSIFLSAALLLLESAAATKNVVLESLSQVPSGWRRVAEADPSKMIRFRVALEQPNVSNGEFERVLYGISNPQHPLYGKHLTREEAKALVQPSKESTDAVISWLESAGIASTDIEDAGDWVNFRTTVGKAGRLLEADFAVYRQNGTNSEKIRTLKYSIPKNIEEHITMIQPTTIFGNMERHKSQVFSVEDTPAYVDDAQAATNLTFKELCSYYTNPLCLRILYEIEGHFSNPNVDTIVGVGGFLEEYAKYESLDTFLNRYAPYAAKQNFTTVLVNGGLNLQNDTADDDVEANLDIQYISALSFDTNINFYSVGGRGPLQPDLDEPSADANTDEPYLEYVEYLLNLTDAELPTTLSTSYGDNEREIPIAYAQKVCTMFGQLGARGVSIIFSSGDSGPGGACETNDGTQTPRFTPTFPGACPYITSVGGTVEVQPEQAAYFSSGGFSDYFPRPSYQDDAVTAYLAKIGDTFSQYYNASGRGFPDVSAQSNGFQVITEGGVQSVAGTSAAAPTFASVIALINNELIGLGKSPLGFLNPWLYSAALTGGGLTDITVGGSLGCGATSSNSGLPTPRIQGAGWNATDGWDPVTGLGTPLFKALLAAAQT
ncbi:tripeptidyl-peptidase 1 [Xylariales sp. PMI_506]|nr:tripeptidyl-peptidase 1 [Xylariales sp. PMI_506]